MDLRRAALAISTAILWGSAALVWGNASALPVIAAQEPAAAATSPAVTPPGSAIDVSRLPLDLHRIERQLRQTSKREDHEGLRLRYFVEVYGKAPKIEIFAPGESVTGPAPWGAPTHKDMLQLVTPKEFRSPPMDFAALMKWVSDKLNK